MQLARTLTGATSMRAMQHVWQAAARRMLLPCPGSAMLAYKSTRAMAKPAADQAELASFSVARVRSCKT